MSEQQTESTSTLDAHVSPANIGAIVTAVAVALPSAQASVERRDWWSLASLVLSIIGATLAGNLRPRRRRREAE